MSLRLVYIDVFSSCENTTETTTITAIKIQFYINYLFQIRYFLQQLASERFFDSGKVEHSIRKASSLTERERSKDLIRLIFGCCCTKEEQGEKNNLFNQENKFTDTFSDFSFYNCNKE